MLKLVFWIPLACLALTVPAFGDDFKTGNCEDSGFVQGPWQDLVRKEPRISAFLDEIARATHQTGNVVSVTNCWVKWPVDADGKALEGNRTVVIDKVWKTDGLLFHHGMKILYRFHKTEEKVLEDGSTSRMRLRDVNGFAFCRTPAVCEALAIPTPAELPTKPDFRLPQVSPEVR